MSALVPLANMFQYVSTLRSLSKGRAQYSMELHAYDFVPVDVEKKVLMCPDMRVICVYFCESLCSPFLPPSVLFSSNASTHLPIYPSLAL